MVGVVGIIIKINSFFFQKPPGYETVSDISNPRVYAFVKHGVYISTISRVSYETVETNTSGGRNEVTYYQKSESMLWGSREITV